MRSRRARLHAAKYARKRRARLRAAKLCINGEKHGKATNGCRCEPCGAVHRGTLASIWDHPAPVDHPAE